MFHPDAFEKYVDGILKKGGVIQRILNPMLGENHEGYRKRNRGVSPIQEDCLKNFVAF